MALLTGSVACLLALVGLPGIAPDQRPVGHEDDLRAAGSVAIGRDGAGSLADPLRRRSCLTRAGDRDPGAALLGGTPRTVDGTPGTLLVLGTDVVGRYRLVVVDDGCRRTLAETTAGR